MAEEEGVFVEKYCEEIDNILSLAIKDRQRYLEDDQFLQVGGDFDKFYITKDNLVFDFIPWGKNELTLKVNSIKSFLKEDTQSHKSLLRDLEIKIIYSIDELANRKELRAADLEKALSEAKENIPYHKKFYMDFDKLCFIPEDSSYAT